MSFRLLAILLCLALPGCHLVDQRDFEADAGHPPVPPPALPGPKPVGSAVTIRYTTPEPDWRGSVEALVGKALERKRDVLFTVTTVMPPGVQPQEATASGREVAQAIVDDGAEPGQVEQTLRLDPDVTVKEVRINVR